MNAKRVLALAGVVLIVALYISTLVLAVIGSEKTMNLFLLSVLMTIMVPVIIHLFLMLSNVRKGKSVMGETYDYRDKTGEDKTGAEGAHDTDLKNDPEGSEDGEGSEDTR